MTIINLRDFFYWYKIDVYIEVSDAVAQDSGRTRRMSLPTGGV
ncbi:MAG: hypothetical protein V8R75_07830 [Oscillospiraceae bacterium]